jgi:glycosyltransferase involved in cell wall biosynthesis
MDFTIITPNLDGGRYLRECLASVAGQGGVEWEHWLIDGGSLDDSLAVAAEFPRVRVVSEPDGGMSEAINKGFDRARGEWVMWLNSDDRLVPGALAAVKDFAAAHGEADVVFGDLRFIDGDGAGMRTVRSPRWSRFVHVHHHCCVPSTACFLRRARVIDEGFRLRPDFRFVMDGEFYARLDAAGKRFVRRRGVLADFRLHGGNASQRHLGKTRDLERILAAERQHVESRAVRRAYGITLFDDPYLNGLADGVLWLAARGWKAVMKV